MHAALACVLYDAGKIFRAEDEWSLAMSADPRFKDAQWVQRDKGGVPWPPLLLDALDRFLELR